MRAYKTNQQQFPVVGFHDNPKVGQAVTVLVERTDFKGRQGEQQFERYGHVFQVTDVDLYAMTVDLEALPTNPLMVMNRPLEHGEQRDAWGKTEFNLLELRAKEAASD